jgi:hypothetical protein
VNGQARRATMDLVCRWDGWLRDNQAALLWDAAARVRPGGQVVEIGSYHGKSTVVLARASAPGVRVVAIDPHAGNDRGPGEWSGPLAAGDADYALFVSHVTEAGVANRVAHVRQFSQRAHAQVDGEIDLLYIDGAHGYGQASSDIVTWGGRVCIGGEMYIHDVFNSVFVTFAVLRHLGASNRWKFCGRERSMAVYRRVDLPARGRARNLISHARSMPWFTRNSAIKLFRAAGLERITVVLGHRPGDGLY